VREGQGHAGSTPATSTIVLRGKTLSVRLTVAGNRGDSELAGHRTAWVQPWWPRSELRVTVANGGFTSGWLNGQRHRKQFESREEAEGESNW